MGSTEVFVFSCDGASVAGCLVLNNLCCRLPPCLSSGLWLLFCSCSSQQSQFTHAQPPVCDGKV